MSTKKEKKQKKKKNVRSESNPESITKDVEIESESSLSKITQKASKKRKNESESESFLGETEQKTSQKQTSQKRKKFEGESEPSLPRRSERIASQEAELASAVRDLGLSSTLSSGYGAEDLPSTFISDYDVEDLPSSASKFKIEDMKALKVNFIGASAEKKVIPNIEATIPEKYVLPKIDSEMLGNSKFNVEKIDGLDEEVQTFVAKLHDVVLNGAQVVGTDETFTDTLVDDLLRITKLNNWPLRIRNHPLCKLYIKDDPYVSSDPEFVIKMRDLAILVVEDKHLKNVGYATNFGESQIAVEILACCSENIRSLGSSPTNQTLWAIRIITSYVTFYKTTIPVKYWEDLAKGLPKEKVVVQRWPAANGLLTGFDLATSEGRRTVLTGLAKIREFLKQHSTSSTAVASQSTSSPAVASQSTSSPAVAPQSTSSPAVAPQSTSSPAVASQGKIEVSSRKDKQKASEN